jgi:hypothetical protein
MPAYAALLQGWPSSMISKSLMISTTGFKVFVIEQYFSCDKAIALATRLGVNEPLKT